MVPRPLVELPGQADFRGIRSGHSRRMDVDDIVGGAVVLGVYEQRIVAALAVDNVMEDAGAKPPIAECGVTEQSGRVEPVVPGCPFLALEMIGQLGRKFGSVDEGEGR